MDPKASRRLAVLSQQLTGANPAAETSASTAPQLTRSPTSGSGPSSSKPNSYYASATGKPTSYAKVHGEVSKAPAQWRRISVVAKEELTDVKYEKAVGEGIAKVCDVCIYTLF